MAVKKRITKFVKSTESASIACSAQESMCGMLGDFDESSQSRYLAYECCEYSNAVQNDANTREETKTISLSDFKSTTLKSSSWSSVMKSMKIVSMYVKKNNVYTSMVDNTWLVFFFIF